MVPGSGEALGTALLRTQHVGPDFKLLLRLHWLTHETVNGKAQNRADGGSTCTTGFAAGGVFPVGEK